MSDVTNVELKQPIPEVIQQIRKPEARSAYSDIFASMTHKYLTEVFNPPQRSAMVEELKRRRGLVLFEGSLLRGTVTERTHDCDIFVIVDDQPIDPDLKQKLSIFIRDIEDYHPEKTSFSNYLSNQASSNQQIKYFIDSRVSELQRRKDYTDKRYGRPPGPAKIEPHYIISLDTGFDHLQNFLNAIETGTDILLVHNDTPTRIIVSVLTSTPDLVHEIVPDVLSYYQRRIVESLVKLQQTDPSKFSAFYSQLEKEFANLHRSTSWRYPERDFRLLAEYYLRSGRFTPQHIEAKQLINIGSRRFTHAVISEEFNHYREKYDVYKNNPDKLLELMIRKHGIETGLTKEDLERIARGEKLAIQEEENLSLEALKELEDFEKRIKLLTAIRKQIKMPTLEEFKQAYLTEE